MSTLPTHSRVERIVTLVHGTFATRAKWMESGSRFRSTLDRELGDGIHCETFRWSGRNSPRARARASRALARHIESVASRYPELPHVIIAHSHGGNVAMYAMRSGDVQKKVHGIIFLSTPFIHANPRAYSDAAELGMMLMGWSLISVPVWFGLRQLFSLTSWLSENLALIAVYAVAMLPTLFVGMFLTDLALRRESMLEFPRLTIPALIIRTPGDEASGVLTFSHFATYLLNRPISIVLFPVGWVWEKLGDLASPVWESGIPGRLLVLIVLGSVAKYVGVALAALGLVCLAITGISGLMLSSFGLGFGLTSSIMEITAEATPPGAWMVHHFESRAQYVGMTDGVKIPKHDVPFWAHSASYEHPKALATIASFVRLAPSTHTGNPAIAKPSLP